MDILYWRVGLATLVFGSTNYLGSTIDHLGIIFKLTDLSDDTITSTATIKMIAISDSGTQIHCGDGETELSWNLIVVDEHGMSVWFYSYKSLTSLNHCLIHVGMI